MLKLDILSLFRPAGASARICGGWLSGSKNSTSHVDEGRHSDSASSLGAMVSSVGEVHVPGVSPGTVWIPRQKRTLVMGIDRQRAVFMCECKN